VEDECPELEHNDREDLENILPLSRRRRVLYRIRHIQEGCDDVRKITAETTLENHHVTYAFQKFEELDPIKVRKPDGMVERVINGQKRVFQHPEQAELTEKGRQSLGHSEQEDLDQYQYEKPSHQKLVERVHQLEHRVGELEQSFEVFRRQVQERL
jgi:hypothetical protein